MTLPFIIHQRGEMNATSVPVWLLHIKEHHSAWLRQNTFTNSNEKLHLQNLMQCLVWKWTIWMFIIVDYSQYMIYLGLYLTVKPQVKSNVELMWTPVADKFSATYKDWHVSISNCVVWSLLISVNRFKRPMEKKVLIAMCFV